MEFDRKFMFFPDNNKTFYFANSLIFFSATLLLGFREKNYRKNDLTLLLVCVYLKE